MTKLTGPICREDDISIELDEISDDMHHQLSQIEISVSRDEDDDDDCSNIGAHYDFSAWDSKNNGSLSVQVQEMLKESRRRSSLHSSQLQEYSEELSNADDSLKLTKVEQHDNKLWQMRIVNDEIFTRKYELTWSEVKEMITIVEFLALKNPSKHPEFLRQRKQRVTKEAIRSIFYPGFQEQKSVLLKRGPVLLNGEERELMLFTGGFVISRVEVDSLIKLLIVTSSSGGIKQLTPEQLNERFIAIDADGGGSLDRSEIREFFHSMGMVLTSAVLDELMKKIDSDSDGTISVHEFKSMVFQLQSQASVGQDRRNSFRSSWQRFAKAITKDDGDTNNLDVAYQMSDIESVKSVGTCQDDAIKNIVGEELAPLTLAVHLEGKKIPLLVMCSKPGHVEAWEVAFRTCMSMRVAYGSETPDMVESKDDDASSSSTDGDLDEIVDKIFDDINEHNNTSNRSRDHDSSIEDGTFNNKKLSANSYVSNKDGAENANVKLTEEEEFDVKVWQMRLTGYEIFAQQYDPAWWEKKEMDAIVEFLALKNPSDHPEFMSKPNQEVTKKAIRSIFYPRIIDRKSVLLKRGMVLLDGEERELMLFTGGFVFSRVELDSLVKLVLDASSSGKIKQLDPDELNARFSLIDADCGGSLDRWEITDFFRRMGMSLNETILDVLMKRFDYDRDGVVSLDEFKEVMRQLQKQSDHHSLKSSWSGFVKAITKDSGTCKLDAAYQVSDIDYVENMGSCENEELKMIVGEDLAPFTLAVYLKGVQVPLLVICTKPGHVEAWAQAFCKCMQMQGLDGTQPDGCIEEPPEKWHDSRIDWGFDG